MRVAFVFAPYSHKRFAENLAVVDQDFGVFPPINLAYAAAVAEKAGHEVCMVDANAERLSTSDTIARLEAFEPDAVGFYFSTYMFRDTLAWARAIKASLGVPVLAGGINLSLYPRETLTHLAIDYGVIGDGQRALPALLRAIEEGREPEGIPGVCYRRDGEVVVQDPPTEEIPFDDYPFPARHLLPNERYYSITSQRRNFTVMMTSLGCVYRCVFCAIAQIPYRKRSVESVLEEMELCVREFGVREIDIFDADFPFERDRTVRICEGILARELDLEWSCRARIDSVDEELLELMYRAGCRKIYFGIETPNEMRLKAMKKNITVKGIRRTIEDAQRIGIRPLGFFMTGVPGETRRSMLRTIRFALDLGLDYAQFSRTIAKPGTDLDRRLIDATGRDFWREWVLGTTPERRLESPWTELDEDVIEHWTKLAYLVFYFRPVWALKTLAAVRSVDELRRGVRTATRMLLSAAKRDR